MYLKPNATLQKQPIRWGLHSLIYYEISLSLVDVWSSTTSKKFIEQNPFLEDFV